MTKHSHTQERTQRITQLSNSRWNRSGNAQVFINPKFLNLVKVRDKVEIALQIAIVHVEIFEVGQIYNFTRHRRHVVGIVAHD